MLLLLLLLCHPRLQLPAEGFSPSSFFLPFLLRDTFLCPPLGLVWPSSCPAVSTSLFLNPFSSPPPPSLPRSSLSCSSTLLLASETSRYGARHPFLRLPSLRFRVTQPDLILNAEGSEGFWTGWRFHPPTSEASRRWTDKQDPALMWGLRVTRHPDVS